MLSIIIINWNGLRVLRPCLESIANTACDLEHEVIVVDNCSSDSSVQMIKESFPHVKIITNDSNLGFAKANNIGIQYSNGKFILLLNNDTVIHPGALKVAISYLSKHNDVGALGGRVEYPNGRFQTSCFRFNTPWVLFLTRFLPLASGFNEKLNYGRYFGKDFQKLTDVDCIAGCFMLLPKWVINLIGPLDEDFFMYGEDEVWCHKIHSQSLRVVIHPKCKVTHAHRYSSSTMPRQLREWEFFSPVLVLEKTMGKSSAWIGNLILTLGNILRLPIWMYYDLLRANRIHDYIILLQKRFRILSKQCYGIVRPTWQQSSSI